MNGGVVVDGEDGEVIDVDGSEVVDEKYDGVVDVGGVVVEVGVVVTK